jgi:ribonuclease P/MRP protein subunit RPP1
LDNGCINEKKYFFDHFEMPFCELRIPVDSNTTENSLSKILISCFDLGYDRVVLCQTDNLRASTANSSSSKKKKRKLNETEETPTASSWSCPKPFVARIPDLIIQRCRQKGRKFRLYSRLNVIVHDNQSLHYLKRAEVQQHFDLISLQPATRDILLYLLNSATVQHELLVLDPSDSELLPFPSKLMRAAADRGIAFELIYCNALRDPFERRNLLAFGRSLATNIFKRGQAIVFSSNATNPLQIRSPYDMMEIGQLFGFNEEISKKMINDNPMDVLARSFSRKQTVQGTVWLDTTKDDKQTTEVKPFVATETILL